MKKSNLFGAVLALFCLPGVFISCSDPSDDSVSNTGYTINFDLNNGTSEKVSVKVTSGSNSEKLGSYFDSIPTCEDKVLLGWATEENTAEPKYDMNSTIELNSNITLYAVWKTQYIQYFTVESVAGTPGKYKISFNISKNVSKYVLSYEHDHDGSGDREIDATARTPGDYTIYEMLNNESMFNFGKADYVYTYTLTAKLKSGGVESSKLVITVPYTGD